MGNLEYEHVDGEALTEDTLKDAVIYDRNDETVGTISRLFGSGPAAQVVVDVGGFLGIGAKRVTIAVNQLEFMREEAGDVYAITALTKDEVKALPEHTD